ncbi:MAG: ATP-binding protein [Burkholderiales bacterium]
MSSLRTRLLVALLGAVLLAGVVASAATYHGARAEVGAMLDEEMRQVALSLRDHAVLDVSRLAPGRGDPDQRVVVQIWDPRGVTVYLSNAASPLPLSRTPGFSDLTHEGRHWRMFTVRSGPQTIQVAQSTSVRTELAAAAALRLLVPILAVLPLLAGLVWLILDRGLAPLARVARAVGTRSPASLEPLPADRLPGEVRPLVDALNGLLARLGDALAVQRRFAADAAHELRTPLTALALQIQLAERAKSDAERAAALARLKEGVKRASRLVQQLLALARLEPEAAETPFAPVALDALVLSVVEDLAPVAAARPVTLAATRLDQVEAQGNEDALRLLLANLLDNALRYALPGGRVEARAFRRGAEAVLEVADDGPGVPAEERGRVFDRFYRVPGTDAPGSGLGLAIARQVADLHHGRIELDDGLGGRGLTARVVLPAAPTP